jgi:hypothetical protein
MDRSTMTTLATLTLCAGASVLGVAWPRGAGAHEASLVADAQGRLDPTYRLTPCPPELYYCGTEIENETLDYQDQENTGQVLNPTGPVTAYASTLINIPVLGAVGGCDVEVTAEPGSLRAKVVALAAGQSYQLLWTDEFDVDQHLDYFRGTSGGGQANATYLDEITFAGPTGAVGNFSLVMTFDRSFDLVGQGGGSASAKVFLFDPSGVGGTLAVTGISDCTNCANPQQMASVPFQATAGATWTLGQQLDGITGIVSSSQSTQVSSITVDAGNTLHAHLEVLTPGFSVTSSSGHDYVSVPEPEAGALGASSVLALAAWSRSRRRIAASASTAAIG